MKKLLLIILVISLSLFCLLIALEQHAFDISKYTNIYDKYNVYDITGKSYHELEDITDGLFTYLKGKAGDEILEPDFNEREILHMRDVQVLFKYGFILKYITIILSLFIIIYFVIKGEKTALCRWIYKGLFVNWIIFALLGIGAYLDFNKYFTYFHYIFFTNDLWLLNPDTDLLIQMLPEDLFSSMAISIGVSFLTYVATIQGIGYAVVKKGRENSEKRYKVFKRE